VRAQHPCAQLPMPGRGALGLCLRLRDERGGRGRQELPGRHGTGPLCSSARGPSLGCGCLGPAVAPSPPPPPASTAGTERDPGDNLGPARCSPLLAFALSSAVCVLCGRADVDPNICGHTLDEKGIRVHQYCLVSSLVLLPDSCWGCSFPFCPNEILLFSLLQEFAITFTEASLIRLATEGLPLGAIRRAAKHATKQVRTRTKQADLCHEGLTPA